MQRAWLGEHAGRSAAATGGLDGGEAAGAAAHPGSL